MICALGRIIPSFLFYLRWRVNANAAIPEECPRVFDHSSRLYVMKNNYGTFLFKFSWFDLDEGVISLSSSLKSNIEKKPLSEIRESICAKSSSAEQVPG